jgi:hypothetical protein
VLWQVEATAMMHSVTVHEAIRSPSGSIRGHQRPSESIRGAHLWQVEATAIAVGEQRLNC